MPTHPTHWDLLGAVPPLLVVSVAVPFPMGIPMKVLCLFWYLRRKSDPVVATRLVASAFTIVTCPLECAGRVDTAPVIAPTDIPLFIPSIFVSGVTIARWYVLPPLRLVSKPSTLALTYVASFAVESRSIYGLLLPQLSQVITTALLRGPISAEVGESDVANDDTTVPATIPVDLEQLHCYSVVGLLGTNAKSLPC